MAKKTVKALVTADGIKFEVDGVIGRSCEDITNDLMSRIEGAQVVDTENKPEFYMEQQVGIDVTGS